MICRACGKEILDDSVFCEFCGTKVDDSVIRQRKREERKVKYQETLDNVKEKSKQLKDEANVKGKELAGKAKVKGKEFVEATKEKSKDFAEITKEKSKQLKEEATEKGKEAGEKMRPKAKELADKLKENRKKVIACGSAAVICIAALLVFIFGVRLSENYTWNKFVKAYNDKSRDDVIALMVPQSEEKILNSYLLHNGINLGPSLDNYFRDKDLNSLKIVGKNRGDKELKKYFDNMLENMGMNIEYSNISLVKMSDDTEIFMYKTGGKWYMLPDSLDYMAQLMAQKDADNASLIASAIHAAFSDQQIFVETYAYDGVYFILKDELPRLPQGLQDAIKEAVGEIPEVSNTRYGGRDFAVYLSTSKSVVNVFVTSDNYVDEWKVYPILDEAYITGQHGEEGETVTHEDVQSELSYARLVDRQSPIAGYWQGDGAGMYIGYDNFKGVDQFVMYSTFETVVFPDAVQLNVGNRKIEGTSDSEGGPWIQLDIKDKDTIDLVYKGYGDDPELKCTLKRSDNKLGEDVLNRYQGEWVCRYGDDILKLEVDKTRGLIHNTNEDQSIFSGDFKCLYDGKDTVRYIFPYRGDIAEAFEIYEPFMGYDVFTYTLNGDELEYTYINVESRMVEGRTWYKPGSDMANISRALNAYDEVIGDAGVETFCTLCYLDDDSIPECIYNNAMGAFEIMTYKNGELVSFYERLYSADSIQYDRSSSLGRIIIGEDEDYEGYCFFRLENGEFESLGFCECYMYSEPASYYVNEEETSESEYTSFRDSFGSFDGVERISLQQSYYDVYEAYEALTGAE